MRAAMQKENANPQEHLNAVVQSCNHLHTLSLKMNSQLSVQPLLNICQSKGRTIKRLDAHGCKDGDSVASDHSYGDDASNGGDVSSLLESCHDCSSHYYL